MKALLILSFLLLVHCGREQTRSTFLSEDSTDYLGYPTANTLGNPDSEWKLTAQVDGSCLAGTEPTFEEFKLIIYDANRQIIETIERISPVTHSINTVFLDRQVDALNLKVEIQEDDVWWDDFVTKCNIGLEATEPASASSVCPGRYSSAESGDHRSQCDEALRLRYERKPDEGYGLAIQYDPTCRIGTEVTAEEYMFLIFDEERQIIDTVRDLSSTEMTDIKRQIASTSDSSAVKVEVQEDDPIYDDFITKCSVGLKSPGPAAASSTCPIRYLQPGGERHHCYEAVRLKLERVGSGD